MCGRGTQVRGPPGGVPGEPLTFKDQDLSYVQVEFEAVLWHPVCHIGHAGGEGPRGVVCGSEREDELGVFGIGDDGAWLT